MNHSLLKTFERLGWTQKQAAQALGITETSISRWVHEKNTVPKIVQRLLYLFEYCPEVMLIYKKRGWISSAQRQSCHRAARQEGETHDTR